MLQTSYEVYIRFMEFKLEDVLKISGAAKDRIVMTTAYRDGKLLFETMRLNLTRLFQDRRLVFFNANAEARKRSKFCSNAPKENSNSASA